jgi:hypothetical protein
MFRSAMHLSLCSAIASSSSGVNGPVSGVRQGIGFLLWRQAAEKLEYDDRAFQGLHFFLRQ